MSASDDSEKTTVLSGDQETLNKELAKAKEQDACLIVIRGARQGHKFALNKSEMVIGRDPNADISIDEASISRKHAMIRKNGGQVTITDLGSSNGTSVNGSKKAKDEATVLSKEDMVKLGSCMLKFLPAGELEILMYGNLEAAAHTDPLTKIFNKGYLLEALEAEFKRAKALKQEFTLLFFDLDHFKKTNDTFGHEAGDYVLKEFSSLIKSQHVREKDVFARYGGEEFVILLSATNSQKGAEIGENIRAAVEAHPFIFEGKRIPVTTSIGVAELTADMESPQTLIKKADAALYQSKEGGRNRVSVSN